jgi:hypothetical protein
MQRLMRGAGLQVVPAHQVGSCAMGQDCRHPGFSSRDPGMLRGLYRALCIARVFPVRCLGPQALLPMSIQHDGRCEWRRPQHRCRCFNRLPTEGYNQGGKFWVRGCRDQELDGTRNTKLRQVRAARCVIPYVL